jgi:hypothetical protein
MCKDVRALAEQPAKHSQAFYLGFRHKFAKPLRAVNLSDTHSLWSELNAARPILDEPEQFKPYALLRRERLFVARKLKLTELPDLVVADVVKHALPPSEFVQGD